MSDAAKTSASADRSPRITELNVSGHLMTLDTGVFCIVQMPSKGADPVSGMPGVRVSVPPGPSSRPEMVEVAGFNPDGWMSGFGDAALVRVTEGPAQVLVTVYQSVGAADQAPNLQVLRLLEAVPPRRTAARVEAAPAVPPSAEPVAAAAQPSVVEMVAHIQGRGDVGVMLGEWLGEPGSKRWIEGFAIAPVHGLTMQDIEYQAVLGRGWLSPWAEGGQFCGSRGMALPVLGLKLRLRGKAAEDFVCEYSGSFVDGVHVGPVAVGEACEAESLAPLEAFQVVIRRRDGKPLVAVPPSAAAAMPAMADVGPASVQLLVPVEAPVVARPKPVRKSAAKPIATGKPLAKPTAKPAVAAKPASKAPDARPVVAAKAVAKPAVATRAKGKPAPKRGR